MFKYSGIEVTFKCIKCQEEFTYRYGTPYSSKEENEKGMSLPTGHMKFDGVCNGPLELIKREVKEY